jgi:hypothetical protein
VKRVRRTSVPRLELVARAVRRTTR